MYKWKKDLYLVSRSFKNGTSTDNIMSKREVQETIKDNHNGFYGTLIINEINYTIGKQLNFKDFVPKCHQKPYKESKYRDESIWLKIWNGLK